MHLLPTEDEIVRILNDTGALRWGHFELPGGAHTIVNYRYDAFGRRVSRTINGVAEWYVYDGDQVVLDVDSATHAVKAEYGYGQGVDNLVYVRTPSWTGAVLNDLRTGTIQGVVGAQTGTTLKRYTTGFWGETAPDTGVIVRFRLS